MSKKIILHLCADIGSDSYFYSIDNEYEVIKIGRDIGVENYKPDFEVHGIIANPPCTEFSNVKNPKLDSGGKGMFLVDHCLRIIRQCKPKFWVLENPASGSLKKFIGKPVFVYQPWEFGSPWTKKTGLWGEFKIPPKKFKNWDEVEKNDKLYVRPGRKKTKPCAVP